MGCATLHILQALKKLREEQERERLVLLQVRDYLLTYCVVVVVPVLFDLVLETNLGVLHIGPGDSHLELKPVPEYHLRIDEPVIQIFRENFEFYRESEFRVPR